jgi:uridine kinase
MNPHAHASEIIVSLLMGNVQSKKKVFTITMAGETGSGKTETGKALVKEFERMGFPAILIGLDNYFFLPPQANDAMRKKDPEWLGPHKEVNLHLLDKNLGDARNGAPTITLPHIDYYSNTETMNTINLEKIKVIIAEGTYTSLLRNVDVKIFIDANYKDTLKFRKLRNRGTEVHDPFVEGILETEHKIIAGHKFLADIIITKDYGVVSANHST